MSDYFEQLKEQDPFTKQYSEKAKEKIKEEKIQEETQPVEDIFQGKTRDIFTERYYPKAKEKIEREEESVEKYGEILSEKQISYLNENLIAGDPNPEEKTYKVKFALDIAKQKGMSFQEAYDKVDDYIQAYWGDTEIKNSYKSAWKALGDVIVMGDNNLKMGQIGSKIMEAERAGNQELVEALMQQYKALEADNMTRVDSVPRSKVVNMLEEGLGSLAYSLESGITTAAMNLILPGIGSMASFEINKEIVAGQKYMEYRTQNPDMDPYIARKAAYIDGYIESGVESLLGEVTQWSGAALKLRGITLPGEKLTNKLTNMVMNKFRMSPGWKTFTRLTIAEIKDLGEEGLEELVGSFASDLSDCYAEALSGLDINQKDFQQMFQDSITAFKGGVNGAIVLGILPTAVNSLIQTSEYFDIKKDAETNPSETLFVKNNIETNIFGSDLSKEEKTEKLKELYKDFAPAREEVWKSNPDSQTRTVEDIKESNVTGEGYIQPEVDQETGEEIPAEIFRDEKGNLHTETEVREDGTEVFKVGDPTKADANLHASMEFTRDEDNNTITITDFAIPAENEVIRMEMFDDFAKENPGYDIIWDPKHATAKAAKQALIEANPRGKKNGLNYYENVSDIVDNKTRREVYESVGKGMPQLSRQERGTYVQLLQAVATNIGTDITSLCENIWGRDNNGNLNPIIGDIKEGEVLANIKKGSFYEGMTEAEVQENYANGTFKENGMVPIDGFQITKGLNSVIYVGQRGDFATLCHETMHAIRPLLSEDFMAKAEEVFHVEDHNWTEQNDEEMAWALVDYVKTGKLYDENNGDFIHKLATLLGSIVKALVENLPEVSAEVKDFYDSIFKSNNDQFNKVFNSIIEQETKGAAKRDSDYRRMIQEQNKLDKENQTEIKETPQNKKAVKEKELQKEREAGYGKTEYINESKKIDSVEAAVNNTLDNTSLPTSIAKNIAEEINNGELTKDSQDQLLNYVVDEEINIEDGLFSIVKEEQLENIIDNVLYKQYADNLEIAKRAYTTAVNNILKVTKDRNQVVTLTEAAKRRIKWETGYEVIDGKWIYEFSDRDNIMFTKPTENSRKQIPDWPTLAGLLRNISADKDITKMDLFFSDVIYSRELFAIDPEMETKKIVFQREDNARANKLNITDKAITINISKLYDEEKTQIGFASLMVYASQLELMRKEGMDITQALNEYNGIYKAENLINRLINQRDKTAEDKETFANSLQFLKDKQDSYINNEVAIIAENVKRSYLKNLEIRSNLAADTIKDTKVDVTAAIRANLDVEKIVREAGRFAVSKRQAEYGMKAIPKLFDEKEAERLTKAMTRMENTPWYHQTIHSLIIRMNIEDILNDRETQLIGKLHKNTPQYEAVRNKKEGILQYLRKHKVVGHADKAVNAINGDYYHCEPSELCAAVCYAANGTYAMASPALKSAMVAYAIDIWPEEVADIFAAQYKIDQNAEYEAGKHIRLLDKGDLSESWLKFIKQVNKRNIHCQIFSKRPELLKQINSEYNICLLSIDESNIDVAMAPGNEKLGIAYVFSGTDKDVEFLNANRERIEKYGGVVLPVKDSDGLLPKELVDKIPDWIRKDARMCPVDGGSVTLENYNCLMCNSRGGVGCFRHHVTKFEKFLDDSPLTERQKGEINDRITELKDQILQFARAGDLDGLRAINDQLVVFTNKVQRFIDSGAKGEISNGLFALAKRKPGLEEYSSRPGRSGREGTSMLRRDRVSDPNVRLDRFKFLSEKFDTLTHIAEIRGENVAAEQQQKEEVFKLDREYLKAIQNNDMEKAQSIIDEVAQRKIDAFYLLQDDKDQTGWKLHKGPAPKKISKMYAVFNVSSDGFRAAYAGNKNPTPVGPWIDAVNLTGYVSDLKTFDDGTPKTYITGDTGSSAGDYFSPEKLKEYGLTKSTRVLLKRGGKHGSDAPCFQQMNLGVDENGNKVTNKIKDGALPHNKLIFEIEVGMSEDGDLTEYVKTNGRMNKGSNEGLENIDPNNFYFFKTNPNAAGQWGIAGTFRIKRLVPYSEIVAKTTEMNNEIRSQNEIIAKNNEGKSKKDQQPLLKEFGLQKWVGGYKPEDSGLTVEMVDQLYKEGLSKKLTDPITYDDNGAIIPPSERFDFNIQDSRFQIAYHGTSQMFSRFDTEKYGLSGEGSMSFGYGAYVTGSEEIARDYARRQYNEKTGAGIQYMLEAAIESRDENKVKLEELGTFEDWSELKNSDIERRKKEIEELKAAGKESKWKEKTLEYAISHNNIDKYNEERDYFVRLIARYDEDIAKLEQQQEEIDATKDQAGKHLLLVDIPDKGYIKWDKNIGRPTLNKIRDALFRKLAYEKDADGYYPYLGVEKELAQELNEVFNSEYEGRSLYGTVSCYLGSDKNASSFLSSIGYAGIDYPAGTNFGNGDGARNYVIFNDDDAKIIDNMLFQTRQELYDDAKQFDTWEDFMDFYVSDFSPEAFNDPTYHNQVPGDADAKWYQTTWELAKGIKPEESLREEEVQDKYNKDGSSVAALDALFTANMENNPEMLDDFLIRIAEIEGTDIEQEYGTVEDNEDAADRDRIQMLQDYIGTQLTHGNWLSNAQRVRNGDPLTTGARNRILGLIRSNPRSYRAIYAEIMEDDSYAVEAEDKMENQLAGKLKRYKLVSPNENLERINPERMKKLADEISNIEIASKIKSGNIKMGNELDNYLKSLRKQISSMEKEFNELEKETQADYQRIADAEKRDLLKLYEKLLKARSEYKVKNDEVTRKIDKGIKISKKYERDSENLRANYNEIFRKFRDLEAVIRIDAETQAAMKRRDQVNEIRTNLKEKKKEQHVVEQIKHLRVQLVKRVMRRVPFNTIDYENAKTLIAIQRVLEPNLMGGVNRWIGTEGPHLRYIVTGILTDTDYKEDLMHYLKGKKQTPSLIKLIDKLESTKSIDELSSWTKGERLAALKFLPKEDWIKDLNLKQLAKEREESIDLEIETKPKQVDMVDDKGKVIIDKATGLPYKLTTWEASPSPDLEERIKNAVGIDMYNNIISRPFAEWTTNEMTELAQIINRLYKEGRDDLAAKKQQKKEEAAAIRNMIEKAAVNTGIVINEDDDDETKKRKQAKINKILGIDNYAVKGTNDAKDSGMFVKLNRLLHGYNDANVRRVARILDNLGEGINVNELYWKENEAYTAKQRSINARAVNIQQVMKDNNISIEDLAKEYNINNVTFTLDELLYFLAADKDYEVDAHKLAKNGGKETDLANNNDYAPTSRNAVMYGNMLSGNAWLEFKKQCRLQDEEMQRRIDAGELTTSEREAEILGILIKKPGTHSYIEACKTMFAKVMEVANSLDEKYLKLLEAIEADYTDQYERMNEVSVNEFNTPVHRVKNYVPLVRLESNGDTNANQVKEDLLGTMGGQSKQWVNKGMTQRRTHQGPLNQKPVQTGLYKTWSNSVERTEHFIAYAPYVRELNAIYKSRDAEITRRKIENRYGKPMLRYIDDYINEVANPNANKVRNAGDELLRTLRGKTAPAYLAWKASAIVKQGLTSPWPYMRFIDPAHYMAASWKCIASRGKLYEVIREKSVFMNNRVMDPMNDLIDEMADQSKNKAERLIANFNKKGMAGLEWIDWISVAPGWLACYEKEYARVSKANEQLYNTTKARLQEENDLMDFNSPEHMSESQIEAEAQKVLIDPEKAAVDYADDCTRQCQPSNRSVDIAPLFKNSSEAMKAYLQFQTSLNVIWQNLRYDIPYDIRNKAGWRIAGTIIGYTLAGIFMNSVMEGYDGGDDDEKEKLKQAIYYATTQFTDAIPMIGSEITNTMDKLITGKQQFMNSGTDMTPTVSKFLAILTNAKKGNWQKAAEMTTEGIFMSLGLPVSGTKEIKKILINDKEKKVEVNLGNVYGILDNVFEDKKEK